MNAILGGGGFHHGCIKTRDWDRTMRFYQDTLGGTGKIAWNFRDTGRRATLATTNGAGPVPIRIFFCEGPSGEVIEFFQNSLT